MAGVQERVALVTGAGRGIGKSVVELLAERGARVMAVARSAAELRALGVDFVAADLRAPQGCAEAVDNTLERLGPIDILICNHGLGSAGEEVLWQQSDETWRESMRVNLDAPFYLTRLVLKHMVERRYGRLVYTSSTAAESAEHGASAYNSAKAGLLGLMRSAARDAGVHGVTANAVLPGWVRTEMAERSARSEADRRDVSVEQVWEERGALYPPGRVVLPEEVAEVIAFLASEESSGVSGQSITVALGASV